MRTNPQTQPPSHAAALAIRNVVLATDFSEPCEKALVEAVRFARLYKARLHLLHVDVGGRPPRETDNHPHWDHSPGPSQERLDAIRKDVVPHFPDVVTEVSFARTPRRGIIDYIREQRADLVVLGSHGYGPVSELFIGSVAQAVVRDSPVPVLVVGYRDKPRASNNVLAALDFTPVFAPALRAADRLAVASGGKLGVLHVVTRDRLDPEGVQRAQERLKQEMEGLGLMSAPELVVRTGRVADAVVEVAETFNAGLAVIAPTRDQPGFQIANSGTVAQILRRSGCPVLVYRDPSVPADES